jgi:hypothetical protein
MDSVGRREFHNGPLANDDGKDTRVAHGFVLGVAVMAESVVMLRTAVS